MKKFAKQTDLQVAIIQTESNLSRRAPLKLPFALILADIIVAVSLLLRNNQSEVLMKTRPLLRKIRQRAMITPVNPPRTRLIPISLSYWTVYRWFKFILE